ncbi:protein FAM72 [Polychytrium aggregatum]|uniref:protein FAM72 n=1 Tax=Polychytrium aggregatum TaxID=110093 RepID=UPI0022FE2288|nr:protein FAM72 [Polychytrium aggregatum]KAI9204807.1 protein FAM72 [Polychytrium aggregatum]
MMTREETEHFAIRPQFRSKVVCLLGCKHCSRVVCKRGMKAILLADMNVELFSTDAPPVGVQLVNDDYQTRNCMCRIRDVACLGCGNVIGYHVTQPCEQCMEACNNGHFWMFHVHEVSTTDRLNATGTKPLVWASLPRADKDLDLSTDTPYESMCR